MTTSFPTGTVTFLFTDIEGSTKLAQEHREQWENLRQRHHAILQSAMDAHNGYVFQIIGDAFCVAFHTAGDTLRAALKSQTDLQNENWGDAPVKVRMGIHTGKAEIQEGSEYQGYLTLSRVQRVMSVAYGGQILISNASGELIRGELPEGVSLLDMKEHRLKGLLNPEHLWQVVAPNLPKDFPPLQSLNDIPNNLPIQLTSFIGREKEITELKQELSNHHLVTLTGSGGTGKTRLSLQVAAEVMDSFPDGVWFLELAPVTDPVLVPYTLGNLLGLRESRESKQTITDLVCGYFHSRKALVVFDNCEHLIETCARFADLLLRSCKDLKILASSREALGVEGEMAWRVPSLSLPEPKELPTLEQLSQYEAVRLFIERATLVQPRFTVTKDNAPAIAQICFRLDGIPLAIELAAARANVLTLNQIAKRLDDRFRLLTGGARTALPRQQTLRALIDWSYNLLSAEESLLFRRLAVFVGGWTLEGAEAVCSGEGLESHQVLDLLSQLVKKSLAVMTEENGESRYHRLETIRQYAREKLFETDEAARIHDRHLDYFIQLAEQGSEELLGPNDLIWIEKLETEHDNFRTALSWSLESPEVDPQKALQLSGALQDFWDTRGYTTEGYRWTTEALKIAPDEPGYDRCRALMTAALFAVRLTYPKEAIEYRKKALAMARGLNHRALLSNILTLLTDDLSTDEMKQCLLESLKIARTDGNLYISALVLYFLGSFFARDGKQGMQQILAARDMAVALANTRILAFGAYFLGIQLTVQGDYAQAQTVLQQGLGLARQLKDKHASAHLLNFMARAASSTKEFDASRRYSEESLQIFRDLSDRGCATQATYTMGWSDYLAGKYDSAASILVQCLATRRDLSLTGTFHPPLIFLGKIACLQGNKSQATEYFAEALKLIEPNGLIWMAHCIHGISLYPDLPAEKIACLLGYAEALRENEVAAIPPAEKNLYDAITNKARTFLDESTFNSAWAKGRALTLEQVKAYVGECLGLVESE